MSTQNETVQQNKNNASSTPASMEQENASSGGYAIAPPAFQLKAGNAGNPPNQNNHSSSGGASLMPPPFQLKAGSGNMPDDVRGQMEGTFQTDFSNVNIHQNSQSATDVGALAYTQGNDVHFAPGQFKPDTSAGQELIGHELTHVVQQRAGRVQPTTQAAGMPVNDDKGLENEADVMGRKAVQMKEQQFNSTTSSIVSNSSTIVQRSVTDSIAETDNQFYAHGGFMGAAPQMLADSKWKRILQVLMPDVYAQATALFTTSVITGLSPIEQSDRIKMFENNPVTAAYGMYQTQQLDINNTNGKSDRIEHMEAFEWDAWFPDDAVSAFQYYDRIENSEESNHRSPSTLMEIIGTSIYNSKEEAIAGVVDNMLIAHGATGETVKENKARGLLGSQYSNVRETEKTDFGGTLPGAWMDIFGKALEMATTDNWEELANQHQQSERHSSDSDKAIDQTFVQQKSFQEVISLYKSIFGKDTFSVLLDIKSRSASSKLLGAVIQELNKRGVHVYGVGTFEFDEIAGLSQIPQIIEGEDSCDVYPGTKEIKFFHYSGELQSACQDGEIMQGDHVMFNVGSLIDYKSVRFGGSKKASYQIKEDTVQQIADYKQIFGFRLGVYVQEFDIDNKAANMITELVNDKADVFDLGFSWGGISGETAAGIEPSLTDGTVGTSTQGTVGEHWDTERPYADPNPAQSLVFDSTYEFYRILRTRTFEVTGDKVKVNLNTDSLGEEEKSFTVQLIQEKDWAFDDDQGKGVFKTGEDQTISWTTLSSGTYYLDISKKGSESILGGKKIKGTIKVFQD